MSKYWRKFQTLLLSDGTVVTIWRGRPGIIENCFRYSFKANLNVSDARVADLNAKGSRYCKYLEVQAWAILNNMGPVIEFKKETSYIGRNGQGKMIGMEIVEVSAEGVVSLTPINTKGLANCNLKIPTESIDDLIRALLKIKAKN